MLKIFLKNYFNEDKTELRLSFVWGLNKDSTTSPSGLIKNVAGTAGGVWMPQISLGWDIRDGIFILNLFATGLRSSLSNLSK